MGPVIIGFCGSEFPPAREAVRAVLPTAELIDIDPSGTGARPVDVLVPLGAVVGARLMDATTPRLIQQFGVGLQGVDRTAAHERGIPVAFVPAATTGNAIAVAELAILHLLSLLRRTTDARTGIAHRWVGQPIGNTLYGKRVTVLGTGAIGTALIPRLAAFDVIVTAIGRRNYHHYPTLTAVLPAERYRPVAELTEVLRETDAVIVCCPLTDDTHGLIGAEQLAAMPPGGWLINVGRGPIVDYTALLAALQSHHLDGAGLDVTWTEPIDPDDPLLREQVCVTPHIGAVTIESYNAMAATFAANALKLNTGQPLDNLAE